MVVLILTDQGELDGTAHVLFAGIPSGAGDAVDLIQSLFQNPVALVPALAHWWSNILSWGLKMAARRLSMRLE
jgi:non-ribosomal peptide synthetase component E (peptide arylation enzyme)